MFFFKALFLSVKIQFNCLHVVHKLIMKTYVVLVVAVVAVIYAPNSMLFYSDEINFNKNNNNNINI